MNRRPRVAHIVNTLPPYWSGTGIAAWNLARALNKRNQYEVSIYTPRTRENRSYDYEFSAVYRQPVFFRIGQAPFTPGILTIGHVDLIHLHFPYYFGAELTMLHSWLRRIPYIITYHNDVIKKGLAGTVVSAHTRYLVPVLLRRAGTICVMSEQFIKTSPVLSRFPNPEKVVVIPQGIETEKFHPSKENDKWMELFGKQKYILFVRSLDAAHHHSGLSDLLRAMPNISSTCDLAIVGDGSLRAGYEQEARDLGVAGRVHFLGAIENRELPSLYGSAHAFVLPSAQTENASMVLMEAMACGIPVVATDVGGTGAVVRHNVDGILIKPRDPGAISTAVNFLLENPEIADEMGREARERVETTSSWSIIASRYEEVYKKVLCTSV
jgi:glycosyltransferase involved in cell wall biosynthesis